MIRDKKLETNRWEKEELDGVASWRIDRARVERQPLGAYIDAVHIGCQHRRRCSEQQQQQQRSACDDVVDAERLHGGVALAVRAGRRNNRTISDSNPAGRDGEIAPKRIL